MYKIDRTNLRKERNFTIRNVVICVIFCIIVAIVLVLNIMGILESGNSDDSFWGILGFLLILGFCIWPIVDTNKKYKEKMMKYDYLEQHGKLERGLKYSLQHANVLKDGKPVMRIKVDYKLDSGSTVELLSEMRLDHRIAGSNGLVDLLIDPSDPTNYYLDFHIE